MDIIHLLVGICLGRNMNLENPEESRKSKLAGNRVGSGIAKKVAKDADTKYVWHKNCWLLNSKKEEVSFFVWYH